MSVLLAEFITMNDRVLHLQLIVSHTLSFEEANHPHSPYHCLLPSLLKRCAANMPSKPCILRPMRHGQDMIKQTLICIQFMAHEKYSELKQSHVCNNLCYILKYHIV